MKKHHLNRFAGIHTAIATVLALSSASHGQNLYWDTNGTATNFGNFAGAWNGTNQFWNSDATGGANGSLTATPTSSNALSIAGAGSTGVLVVSGNQTAASIDFANTANLAAMRVGTAGGPVMSLNVTGDITDTGAGGADIRIVNMNASNAATILTANLISIGVISFAEESFSNAQFWSTGYDMTIFTQFSLGRGNGNYTYTQTGGIVKVNDVNRGISFNAGAGDDVTSPTRFHTYNMNGGEIRVGRLGVNVQNDGDNNTGNRYSSTAKLEFNDGTIQNAATNGTLLFQNGIAFKDYTGSGTKDMQYNTHLPLTVTLSQTGVPTINADGFNSSIIVTPGAQLVDKETEAGTLAKTGLGNLILTGGGPVAVNSWTGSTTISAGKVTTDFSLIGGQPATGDTDSLSNAYSAVSPLVLNGGNFELKGRSSATAGTTTGVTLNSGFAGMQVNVGSTTNLVVGQSVTNANLPAGTYIRRIINATTVELSAMSTSTTSQAGQTLDFGAATFDNTQTIDSVDLQLDATATVTPGAGSSTTLLSFGDVTGSGKLTKAGAGALKLTGTVSHTGATAINAGILEFASASDRTVTAAITGTASGTLVKSGAGNLSINCVPGANSFSGSVIVNEGTLANADSGAGLLSASSFTVNNNGILTVSSSGLGFGTMGALTVNAGGIFRGGFQNLGSVTLNGGTIEGTGSFGSNNFALGSDVTVGGSSPSTIQGTQRLALNTASGAIGDTRTFNVDDVTGDPDADLTITCVVHNAHVANGQPGGNLTKLQKTGAGTLVLSGVNTYTGETIVLEGTLAVNGTSINNSAQLTIDGGWVNLSGAETVNALFIDGAQQAAGTYSSDGGGGTIASANLTGSGTLIVTTGPVSVSGYAAWQSANGTSQAADLDHDNDGISNGIEHFLGGIANTTGNGNPLPSVINTAGTLSVTWVRNPDFLGFPSNYGISFLVETSATPENPWTPAVQGVGAGSVEITGDNVKYTFPAGTKNFARLKLITP